jgi:cobalt-zinc-cadmium efflux system protein
MNGSGHHRHAHQRGAPNFGTAFAVGTVLNIAFVLVEIIWGVLANSMALLADAGHNASDVLSLLLAWGATSLARRPPTGRYTYGYRGSSIFAALANAVLLLVAVGGIAWEAVLRFSDPQPVAGTTVIVVAAIGVIINGITAWLFASGRQGDLNIRGAFLHMAADAAVSLGVVVAGALIVSTGWVWLDPAVSLVIVVIIMWSTWGLLRDSVNMALAAVPKDVDLPGVRAYLEQLPDVTSIHDLHIWPMSTTETALTVHLVMPKGRPADAFLVDVSHELHARFSIHHPTLQIETNPDTACELAPEHVV